MKKKDIYKNNAGAFEKRYGIRLPEEKNSKYAIETARNGENTLYVIIGAGKKLRLNSAYNPSHEAEIWARGRDIPYRRTTVVLCGFSTGVFLKELLNVYRPDTEFFVYEPDEKLFTYICSFEDISEIILNRRVHLFITESQKNRMVDEIYDDVIGGRSEVVGVTTPFYSANEQFLHICEEVSRLSVSIRNFKMTRGREALKCRIYSWKHMKGNHFLSDLGPYFTADMPAIIVSAGPSLEKNVDKLKIMKDYAFILATDRSLSTLKEHDVVPDAVISIDAIKNSKYLEYAFEKKLPIICSYQLNEETQKKSDGRLFFFDALSYERKLFGDKAQLGSGLDLGGNVAGGAFVVLKLLGIKTIILVGQDLAFVNGRHHADNIEDGMPIDQDIIEVPGIDGNTVKTTRMWIKYRDFFTRQIKQNPDIRLIDATEGGALIEGSEVISLEKAKEGIVYRKKEFEEFLREISYEGFDAQIKRADEIMELWSAELRKIVDISEELHSACKKLLELYRNKKTANNIKTEIEYFNDLRNRLHKMDMNRMLEEFWVEDMYAIPPRVLVMTSEDLAIRALNEAENYYEKLASDAGSLYGVLSN